MIFPSRFSEFSSTTLEGLGKSCLHVKEALRSMGRHSGSRPPIWRLNVSAIFRRSPTPLILQFFSSWKTKRYYLYCYRHHLGLVLDQQRGQPILGVASLGRQEWSSTRHSPCLLRWRKRSAAISLESSLTGTVWRIFWAHRTCNWTSAMAMESHGATVLRSSIIASDTDLIEMWFRFRGISKSCCIYQSQIVHKEAEYEYFIL